MCIMFFCLDCKNKKCIIELRFFFCVMCIQNVAEIFVYRRMIISKCEVTFTLHLQSNLKLKNISLLNVFELLIQNL